MRRSRSLGFGLALVVAAIALLISQGAPSMAGVAERTPLPPGPAATPFPATAPVALFREPVAFVPNLGQWDGPFSHKARMGPMTVFLQERGWTFTLVELPQRAQPDPFARMTTQPGPASAPARGVAVQMHFEGGTGPALPIEEQRLPGVHNYFLGNDPERWRSNVPLHAAVLLSGLYPGIDLRARSEDGHFEYDLLVEPGAELEQVVVTVEGADGLRLDPDGILIIDTALGPVCQPLPKTWQVTADGNREEIACRYVLRGVSTFGFEASDRNPDLGLVVDPSLIYSTYLGGGDDDWANSVALDASGAATVAGETWSTNFPTTAGAFSTTYNGGNNDAFITRLAPSGSALVYSTYLGGNQQDRAFSVALDASGAATVTGDTGSTNFPTTAGAFDTSFNGGVDDAFITRLDPSGSALIYSTYLGGGGNDVANSVALDASGAATVAGMTYSMNFPTTVGAFAPSFNGGSADAFVVRLDLGTTIGLSQPGGPGTPITIDNGYLIPGNEYYNIFSLDLCPAGPGTGPYLGLCATTLANIQFLVLQASLPVGSPPFHFVATAPSMSWGPYTVGPGTLDALCLDVTGGVLGSYSPVTRVTIQ